MSLHELEVVTLGKGLTVFRPAMTLICVAVHAVRKRTMRPSRSTTKKRPANACHGDLCQDGYRLIDKAQQLPQIFRCRSRSFVRRWLPDARPKSAARQPRPGSALSRS
jgi:hypothetical protein